MSPDETQPSPSARPEVIPVAKVCARRSSIRADNVKRTVVVRYLILAGEGHDTPQPDEAPEPGLPGIDLVFPFAVLDEIHKRTHGGLKCPPNDRVPLASALCTTTRVVTTFARQVEAAPSSEPPSTDPTPLEMRHDDEGADSPGP